MRRGEDVYVERPHHDATWGGMQRFGLAVGFILFAFFSCDS